mmetsp:Transcript_29181/g.61977  ORF Transcript_29181/g.61977 Transcript_29181/m.61977 type:complete len:300 (+) Transcript_29181:1047-1946(+)
MRSGPLNCPSTHGNVRLHRSRSMTARKLLLLRLIPRNDRNGQKLLVHPPVQIQRLHHHLISILVRRMRRMTLLPQKLPRSQKRSGILELPPHDVTPLIQLQRQIPMTSNPISKCRIHDRLGSGPDGNGSSQLPVTGMSHPRHFGSESLDVILFLFQSIFRNEHGKIRVFHAQFLDLDVEPVLDQFPYFVGPGTEDVAAGDVVVGNHFGEDDDIGVPHGEVFGFGPFEGQLGFSLFGLFFVLVGFRGGRGGCVVFGFGGDLGFGFGFVARWTRGWDFARQGCFILGRKGEDGGFDSRRLL